MLMRWPIYFCGVCIGWAVARAYVTRDVHLVDWLVFLLAFAWAAWGVYHDVRD